jgi:hypothetical membrane protein
MTECKKCFASLAVAGVVAAALFIVMWVITMSLDTSWVLGQNTLSDFGVSATDAKYYFNYGCMIIGALLAIFGLGIVLDRKNPGYVTSGLLLIIGGIAFIGIGYFTKDFGNGNLHVFIATFFGIVMMFAMIAMAAGDWKEGKIFAGGIGLVVLIVCISSFLVLPMAAWEALAAVFTCIWMTTQSVKILLG